MNSTGGIGYITSSAIWAPATFSKLQIVQKYYLIRQHIINGFISLQLSHFPSPIKEFPQWSLSIFHIQFAFFVFLLYDWWFIMGKFQRHVI